MDVTDLLDLDSFPDTTPYIDRHSIHRGKLCDGIRVAAKTSGLYYFGEERRKRLPKLLDIWAKCSHQNIVQLIGQATFRNDLALVYAWHKYGSITEYLNINPSADRYQLSAQICDGVAYLHANDIVHGGLDADQILISGDGVPRIQLSVWSSSTIADAVTGLKPLYRSLPETLAGSKCTFARDVFALGMTILETITRIKSSDGNSLMVLVYSKVYVGKTPPRPTDIISESDAGNAIWGILCESWSYNPAARPSAAHIRDIMNTVHQTPDGVALKQLRLVVTEETTLQHLVSHFEQRRLMNYTELLDPTRALVTESVADTALANVYRVELLNRHSVAVKCVKHNTSYKRLKRAARELDCWLSHKHENILPVLGFAVVGTNLAMVSPWMNNGHVTDYVATNPNCDRLILCVQLAKAVAYLHENNVVHGDIKGPNVLVSDLGAIQVTDFGVSIMDHQEIEFSITSSGRGTQRWQAPEILLGQSDSTRRADVYALSMTMIEIYTGEQPYGSTNWLQIMMSVLSGQLRPSRPIRLPIDENGTGVWKLMNHCWMANPSERPTSTQVYQWLLYYSSMRATA